MFPLSLFASLAFFAVVPIRTTAKDAKDTKGENGSLQR
jgi:hypothetical protein